MRLKTYIVNNVSEALPMIKKDLGAEALILNTKKIKTGGFLGLFMKEKMEVIAAVESKPSAKTKKNELAKVEPEIDPLPEPKTGSYEKPALSSAEGSLTTELLSELKGLKRFMMQSLDAARLPPALQGLSQRLSKQEITEEIQAELFAELLAALDQNPDYTEQQLYALAHEEIIKLIKNHQKPVAGKNPEIICFIGPTGVGKTTTIAKIAADYMLREDKKVGLITSDTYRIAAVEQLKTYAGILNIPIKVVESSADLTNAMAELSDCDIVLMDTAGRNYQQKRYIEELELLLADSNRMQINLVLSLTSKYEDMKKIIDNFQTFAMDQVLLTKQDETSSSGAILNLVYHYSIPIPYIANGQNVPDDILKVSPELIANFILGEDEND